MLDISHFFKAYKDFKHYQTSKRRTKVLKGLLHNAFQGFFCSATVKDGIMIDFQKNVKIARQPENKKHDKPKKLLKKIPFTYRRKTRGETEPF